MIKKLILFSSLFLSGLYLSAQEKGFLSIMEDAQGRSMKPSDIVETSDGGFLISTFENEGMSSKIIKIDNEGIFVNEIDFSMQDTTVKLTNIFPLNNEDCYKVVGVCIPENNDYAAIITIWIDSNLTILDSCIETISFSDQALYSFRFLNQNNSVVSALIFKTLGQQGETYLSRLSEEGRVVRYQECNSDSILFMDNLFNIRSNPNHFGMYARTSGSSLAMSGVHVFDSSLRIVRSRYFNRWHTEGSTVFSATMNAIECMMAPLPDGNYAISTKLDSQEIYTNGNLIWEDRSVILLKADPDFNLLQDSIIIEYKNDSIEIPAVFRSVDYNNDGYLYQCSNGNVVYPNMSYRPGLHLIVTKTDIDLNIVWQKRYLKGGTAFLGYTSLATSDGGYIVTGTHYDMTGNYCYDVFVLKINPDGSVGTDEISVEDVRPYTFIPNPAHDHVSFQYSNDVNPAQIEVYDLQGRLLHKQCNDLEQLQLQSLTVGQYLINITMKDGRLYTDKVVKE